MLDDLDLKTLMEDEDEFLDCEVGVEEEDPTHETRGTVATWEKVVGSAYWRSFAPRTDRVYDCWVACSYRLSFHTIYSDCIHVLMKRAWHVVCEIWEVWLRFKADPRNLKREKLQNPTSAKIATLENFPLYSMFTQAMCVIKSWSLYSQDATSCARASNPPWLDTLDGNCIVAFV